ncbi:hypothetical protein [Ammoniphilus sp. 3BR4]
MNRIFPERSGLMSGLLMGIATLAGVIGPKANDGSLAFFVSS